MIDFIPPERRKRHTQPAGGYKRAEDVGIRRRPLLAFIHRWFVAALCFLLGLLIGMGIMAARADEWNTADKALFGSYVALTTWDALQTDQGMRSGKFVEQNPLYGERPSTARLFATKAAMTGAIWWLADRCPQARRAILLIGNAMEISVVAHNASIGMNVKF
jgi:hypothetical protein